MTEAVMEEAMKGLVAPTKFLFEVAGVFPPAANGEQATEEEDCLAKTLLARLNIPKKPAQDEEDEPAADVDDGTNSEKSGDEKVGAVAVTGESLDPTTLGTEDGRVRTPTLAAKDAAPAGSVVVTGMGDA